MEHFDTVLIGSGYTSVGYAAAHGSTLIVEEQEIADTHFYLPLRSFCHIPYIPKTDGGRALDAIFRELALFVGDRQNTNGFECALCRYLNEHPLPILLKCRVVDREEADGGQILTLSTNEGLLRVFARHVIDTRTRGERRLTVLITAKERDAAVQAAKSTGWAIEDGFYPDQYALYAPDTGLDENSVKPIIYESVAGLSGIRLLAIAPVYAHAGVGATLSDDDFDNPIAAFEAGYLLGKEAAQ